MSDRELFVILNPAADRGRAEAMAAPLERAMRGARVGYQLVRTRARGHAKDLAQQAAGEGWSTVIAVGGDGVVHEVVNGLMAGSGGEPATALGIVGVGSGNDFIKMLDLPHHEPAEAVRRILAAEPRRVDIGRVSHFVGTGGPPGEWFFTNGVGMGFDAQVAHAARGVRRLRGMAIYAWALAKTLRNLSAPRIRVVVDGAEIADRELILTTVSNGPCHGGSFWLCPGALLDDGLLDILIADGRSLPRVMTLLPRVMRGTHVGQRGVELHRGRHIQVRSETPLPIHADGEIVADTVHEIDLEVVPGRLKVLA
jgi:diacylglycerol kinase (ATP)